MKLVNWKSVLTLGVALVIGVAAFAQVHRYYNPGSVWTVTTIRIRAGMEPAYLQYLDGAFKKESDAQVKAGYMKSYKILSTLDEDANSWNLVILREFASLASFEANEEKSDELSRKVLGEDDTAAMKGYEDRSKVREVLGTRTARELILK